MEFRIRRVEFAAGGISLVGDMYLPDEPQRLGCVVLHPHPLYGGDRHNNVTKSIAQGLAASGFATLAFDFRGAGESSGSHGGGVDETADVAAALEELQSCVPELDGVALVGYSFGAHVASLALNTCSPAAVICVAPPVAMFPMDGLSRFIGPMLLIAGDMDQFGPLDGVTALAEKTGAELQRLGGADHFLLGRESEVADKIVDFLDRATGL